MAFFGFRKLMDFMSSPGVAFCGLMVLFPEGFLSSTFDSAGSGL